MWFMQNSGALLGDFPPWVPKCSQDKAPVKPRAGDGVMGAQHEQGTPQLWVQALKSPTCLSLTQHLLAELCGPGAEGGKKGLQPSHLGSVLSPGVLLELAIPTGLNTCCGCREGWTPLNLSTRM